MNFRHFLCAGAMLALAACASPTTVAPALDKAAVMGETQAQAQYALRAQLVEQERLQQVSARLFRANADLCPAKRQKIGLNFANAYTFETRFRSAAREGLGLSEAPQVVTIIAGGPAEKAGIKLGDVITSVQDEPIAGGAGAVGDLGRKLKTHLAARSSVKLGVSGTSGDRVVEIVPETYCGYDVELSNSGDINAYANGEAIIVTHGMMRLAASDQELALVVAHELAHNSEGHLGAKKKNATAGMVGGVLVDVLFAAGGVDTQGAFTKAGSQAGAGYASAAFEAEADYVGLYYMARAGFETQGAADFWRKMSVEAPSSIFIKSSHPANPDRYLAIAAADKEIQEHRTAGQALLPERKSK